MGMTFNKGSFYPYTEKDKKKKAEEKKKEQQKEKELIEAVKPVFGKKEGIKKELSIMQLEDALFDGDKSNISTKGIKKVAEAAADDKQLTRSLRKMERDLFRGGGRAGSKSGSKGCKLAKKGKGRAYGKNS